jgi:hypothetical protein
MIHRSIQDISNLQSGGLPNYERPDKTSIFHIDNHRSESVDWQWGRQLIEKVSLMLIRFPL